MKIDKFYISIYFSRCLFGLHCLKYQIVGMVYPLEYRVCHFELQTPIYVHYLHTHRKILQLLNNQLQNYKQNYIHLLKYIWLTVWCRVMITGTFKSQSTKEWNKLFGRALIDTLAFSKSIQMIKHFKQSSTGLMNCTNYCTATTTQRF